MKLRTKIQLFTSLFMLVLILLINASIYFLFYSNTVDSELEELTEQVNTIVSNLNANPDIPPTELLKAFLPADGIIRVYPESGNPIVHSKDKEFLSLPGAFTNAETSEIILFEGERFATVSKPIIWNNGDVVTLQLSKQLVALSENMRTLFYVLVLASLIILIPTIIAGNVLGRFLLRPVKSLIHTMRENIKYARWKKIDLSNRSKDELYEMEKTFNDMIDSLKESYEMQEIFVSDASHELKTPISIIKSYAQLVERRGMDNTELMKESIEAITLEAERMQKLVEQMLALAKNKEVHHAEVVDMNQLMEETIAIFTGAYGREITLKHDSEAHFVQGNTDQLKQVLYILMDNAHKYSEDKVDVRIGEKDDAVIIDIIDSGGGIPQQERDRVFERFYRIDKARSRNTGGTGLGLAIAKSITLAHGGKIEVESEAGKGSTFTIKLPAFKKMDSEN
ncbi:HAMP domain-containing sensor histidine kinase [Ornithinibacillus xuwenensis]|uniref:Signal transduction histidine-protein kinase ArlS n=1 Tax=Ornithinibacillus xuwenensis TaxID=3144668 RepID=A0ABU9XLT2_9BACI